MIKILLALFISSVPVHGMIIQCYFNIGNLDNILIDVYYCQASIVSSENPSSVTEIRGQHLSGKSNDDVKYVYIYGSPSTIPSGIGNFFPNLQGFLWDESNLTSLKAEDLQQFPNLISLYVRNQAIESLDGDVFKFTPKLKSINLSYNKLQNVGLGLLSDLPELQQVNLRSNICVNIQADNAQQIQALKEELPTKCPPLITSTEQPTTTISTTTTSTTTENVCEVRCSINEEVEELRAKLVEQIEINAMNEERFTELEKMIREILATP